MSAADERIADEGDIGPVSAEYIAPGLRISLKEFSCSETQSFGLMPFLRDHVFWIRVMEGELCFMIDGRCVNVRADETLFINSRHFNRFCSVKAAPARFRAVGALPDAVRAPALEEKIRGMLMDDSFAYTVIRPVSELFSYDLDALFDLAERKPEEYEFEAAAHFLLLLRQIYRVYRHASPNETIIRSHDLQILREMLSFIGENYRDEITVDQIAAAGRMSRSRCTRLFRQYLQESPIEHVQKYRLQRSVYLINNTDLQFAEIAGRCGFNQQSYFNRLFIRHYGMTPGQMRANKNAESGRFRAGKTSDAANRKNKNNPDIDEGKQKRKPSDQTGR